MSEDAKHTALYEWGKIRNRNRARAPSMAETVAFGDGFDAAMRFMAQPRIPLTLTPTQKGPDVIAARYVGESRMSIRLADGTIVPSPITEEDLKSEDFHSGVEAARALFGNTPKEHNPHGLVSFYTDAPDV